jgi:formate hydrogenlyase subunit 4
MIHEAMLLEYSARHLALMEWAAALKLFNYACIGFALFIPWGATGEAAPVDCCSARFRCWRSSSSSRASRSR